MKLLQWLFAVVCVFTFNAQVTALSIEQGSAKVEVYEKVIEKRYGYRIAKLDTKVLGKLSGLISERMASLMPENDGSIAVKTQQILDVYIAFANIIEEYNMISLEVESVLWDEWMSNLTITIIDDVRCSDCQTDTIVEQLKRVPALQGTTYVMKDFSDDGVADMLEKEEIKFLPAVIFSHNDVSSDLKQYLVRLNSETYSLKVWARYDPFIVYSDKGYQLIDVSVHSSLLEDAHLQGAVNAKITWIEYTDTLCHFCKKMLKDETVKTILAEFPNDVNMAYSNFIWVWGATAQATAEVLECAAMQWWATVYNTMMHTTMKDGLTDVEDILDLSSANGIDREKLNTCYKDWDAKEIVAKKFATGRTVFGITGTPGNVLINNETREYVIVSGAYSASKFREVVQDLLEE